jgi:hypothetical protein
MKFEEGGCIMERPGKPTKNLSPEHVSNQAPPELKSRKLPLHQLAWFKSEQKFQLNILLITPTP